MKVLMAAHNFPPEFTGGVERATESLALELAELGHEVAVFAGSRDAADESAVLEENRQGIRVHRFKRRGGYHNVVDTHDPEGSLAWDRLLDDFRPDLVHVHHWYHLTNDLVARAAIRGIPAVCTLHDFWSTCALFFRMPGDLDFCEESERSESCLPCVSQRHPMEADEMRFSFAMRFAALGQELALARAVLVSSAGHLRRIAALGRFPREVFSRVRILPMGVRSGVEPQPARPDRTRDESATVVIGHWGNLSRIKGVELLVRAAARCKSARRLRLKLLGECLDDALKVRLRDLAGAVRLDMPGAYDGDALGSLVEDVDFAVFPSLAMETHSLVLDEALKLGLPVVVSDRGAMPERVGGRGIVVPAGDVDALSKALDALADPETRRGHAAAPTGTLVESDHYARQVEEVYTELVGQRGEVAPAVVDHGARRLAFRNHRLAEIARYLGGIEEERHDTELALGGDAPALARLRKSSPALAARIEILLEEEQERA